MRTLPAAITSALASPGQQPTLTLTIQDLLAHFSLLATGASSGRSAALVTSAGTILRAVVPQAANPNTVLMTRVTTPTSASQWTQYTQITSDATATAGCALSQSGALIRCFYQRSADSLICYRDSSDDGATWGAEQTIVPTSGPNPPLVLGNHCYGLASDGTSNLWAAFASYDPGGNAALYKTTDGGPWIPWSNEGPGSPSWGKIRGLQVITQDSITHAFVAGVQLRAGLSGISAGLFTHTGASYSAITPIQSQDNPDTGISLAYPSLHYDPPSALYYASITAADDGSVSGTPSTRTTVLTSPDLVSWSPTATLANAFQAGSHALIAGSLLYLLDATSVYTGRASQSTSDVSDDVLALSLHEQVDEPARATITLSNASGQYNQHPSVRPDARLSLSLGYSGTTIPTHTLTLETYTYQATSTQDTLLLTARDHTRLLDYESSRSIAYSGSTVGQLIANLCALAGATPAALPATPQFSQVVPCFILSPGETYLTALKRLSQLYGFSYLADATPQLRILEPALADPISWSYGGEVLALAWGQSADQANVIRVVGAVAGSGTQPFAQVYDPANLLLVGKERHSRVLDRLLDTAGKCAIRAGLELRKEQRAATSAQLTCAMNPAHELGDVLTLTDPALGLAASPVRIVALSLAIDPEHGQWTHHLQLSGV